jgi:hypothetical protein
MSKEKDIFGRLIPRIKGMGVYINTIHEKENVPILKAKLVLPAKKENYGDYFFTYVSPEAKVAYTNKKEDFINLIKKSIDIDGLRSLNQKDVNNFSLSDIDCIWDAEDEIIYIKKNKNLRINIKIK